MFDAYPFILPNLTLSVVAATSFVAGFFYIEEVRIAWCHHSRRMLILYLQKSLEASKQQTAIFEDNEEREALLTDETRAYKPSLKEAISPKVIQVIVSYALMAFHTICFDQLFPVFMVTPHATSHLPFLLNGGLGFGTNLSASLISAAGVFFVGLMVTVFPLVDSWLGSIRCLQSSLMIYPLTYSLLPYLVALPESPAWIQITATSAVLVAKSVAAVFSFNENSVLLSAVAPSRNTLGLINGIGQTAAAGARGLGPAAMGFFIGVGDSIGSGALGWWFLAAVAVVGAVQGLFVEDGAEVA